MDDEVFHKISLLNINTYSIMLVIPSVARWAHHNQIWLRCRFTRSIITNYATFYVLTNKNIKLDTPTDFAKNSKYLHCENGPAIIAKNGTKCWYQFGKIHRLDGPAAFYYLYNSFIISHPDDKWNIYKDIPNTLCCLNIIEWYQNGILHRDNGPAYEEVKNSVKKWYQNGKLHRDNGPAIEEVGKKEWYHHGLLHRDDGPAVIEGINDRMWFQYGNPHRIDGPAIETNALLAWYENGKFICSEPN